MCSCFKNEFQQRKLLNGGPEIPLIAISFPGKSYIAAAANRIPETTTNDNHRQLNTTMKAQVR
jgi:hypothetical protein